MTTQSTDTAPSHKYAIVEVTDYYGDPHTHVVLTGTYPTQDGAEDAKGVIDSEIYRLDHNQASGYHLVVPLLDDEACYRTWVDNVDWDGCPHDDPDPEAETDSDFDQDTENILWAEQRAISEGGTLCVVGPRGGLVLVEMPAEEPEEQVPSEEWVAREADCPESPDYEQTTEAQIVTLRDEAAEAGDLAQVALCELALDSVTVDPDSDSAYAQAVEDALAAGETVASARTKCAWVIADAAAAADCGHPAVGSRVEAGDTPEDHDCGRVTAVDGDQITVAWDGSGEQTKQHVSLLREEG